MADADLRQAWILSSIVVNDHTTAHPRCAACSLFLVTAALFLVTAARTPSSDFVSLTRGCCPLGSKPQQKQEPRPQISQRVWSSQISGANPLAHAPCLNVSYTAVSSTAVSLHWWIAIFALASLLVPAEPR